MSKLPNYHKHGRVPISVWLRKTVKDALEAEAEERDTSLSTVIRDILNEHVTEYGYLASVKEDQNQEKLPLTDEAEEEGDSGS